MADLVVEAGPPTTLQNGIHRYDSVTVRRGGVLTVTGWNGRAGGALQLEVSGDIVVEAGGKIDVSGLGHRGGANEGGHQHDGMSAQGEAAGGRGAQSTAGNGGGGGGGISGCNYGSAGGGGGGYGSQGEASQPNPHGEAHPGGHGGQAHGSPDLVGGLSLGSGGGAGKSYQHRNGAPIFGGAGGGIVHLVANRIVISRNSDLLANGAAGAAGGVNWSSGGGGGSGGTIHITTANMSLKGRVSAAGGAAGAAGPPGGSF